MIRPIKGYISAMDTALSFKPRYFLPEVGLSIVGEKIVGLLEISATHLNIFMMKP